MPSSPGLSISSAPLAFLAKLRNKKNPYAQPYHPNNNDNHGYSHLSAHIYDTCSDTESCHDSPHSDLLAQARQVAGRHPVTGRRVSNNASPQAKLQTQPRPQTHTRSKIWRRKAKQEATTMTTSVDEAREQKRAYLAWAAENPQTRGSPYESYEEFVREKVMRRGLGEQTWARGEYYAPG